MMVQQMKEMKIRKRFSDELVEHLYVIVADGDYFRPGYHIVKTGVRNGLCIYEELSSAKRSYTYFKGRYPSVKLVQFDVSGTTVLEESEDNNGNV
ncbi:hypothetical protein [Lactobacillus crispatus]|nr:hypothetical protein [Lactobacillus crispatus]